MKTLVRLLLVLSLSASFLQIAQAGDLSDLRHEVRDKSSKPANPASSNSNNNSNSSSSSYLSFDDEDDDDDDGSLLGKLYFLGLTSPFWLPHSLTKDNFSNESLFLKSPYDDKHRGSMAINWADGHEQLQSLSARLRSYYVDDSNGTSSIGVAYCLTANSV
ncbi:MAG: hypothetical protein CMJ78_17170 [Planctomycetaceae bacterium]|nr:hypothetical protein [Planctomycetaceae bacterium]